MFDRRDLIIALTIRYACIKNLVQKLRFSLELSVEGRTIIDGSISSYLSSQIYTALPVHGLHVELSCIVEGKVKLTSIN